MILTRASFRSVYLPSFSYLNVLPVSCGAIMSSGCSRWLLCLALAAWSAVTGVPVCKPVGMYDALSLPSLLLLICPILSWSAKQQWPVNKNVQTWQLFLHANFLKVEVGAAEMWINQLRITPQSLFSGPPDQSTSMFTSSLVQEWSGRVFWYAVWCHYAKWSIVLNDIANRSQHGETIPFIECDNSISGVLCLVQLHLYSSCEAEVISCLPCHRSLYEKLLHWAWLRLDAHASYPSVSKNKLKPRQPANTSATQPDWILPAMTGTRHRTMKQ